MITAIHAAFSHFVLNLFATLGSTITKATMCLLAQGRPRSFITGNEVDLGTVLSAYNAREFHHIYPKAYLSDIGIGFHEANTIPNICFLSSSDNKAISDKSPEEYFPTIPADKKNEILKSSFIPIAAADGKMTFEDFIVERSKILVKKAKLLIEKGTL